MADRKHRAALRDLQMLSVKPAPRRSSSSRSSSSRSSSSSSSSSSFSSSSSSSGSSSKRVPSSGRFASQISSVMSDFSYRDTMSKTIYQQICNGTYRSVELLNIIAQQHGFSTSSVMSDFSYRDTMSKNIYQQICNGTYRTVELLNLIAKKFDE